MQTFTSNSYGSNTAYLFSVVASNSGTIDLSKVSSVSGAIQTDDYLRFRMETGGTINLAELKSVTGHTLFEAVGGDYSLPKLQSAQDTFFTVGTGYTFNLPALTSMTNGSYGAGFNVGAGATLNAPLLISMDANAPASTGRSGTISIGTGGTLNTPQLKTLNNASLTWSPGQTFNHALTNVDGSEFSVVQGATLNLSGVTAYTNTLSNYNGNPTLLSADGAGSLLDLSGVQTFTSNSYGSNTAYLFSVVASNSGTIDLSKVSSVSGAIQTDDYLRFRMETGGTINLAELKSVTGHTLFEAVGGDYSLPKLQSAQDTFFTVGTGYTFNLPALTSMTNGSYGAGFNVGAGATLNAPLLISMDANAPASTGRSGTISIGTGGTLNTPQLKTLNNASLTWSPGQTFNHALTNVDGSEFSVVQGATLNLSGVTAYTNTLSNYNGNPTLLSADGAGSLLDLSGVQTFTSNSYGSNTAYLFSVVASNSGTIDLSKVSSVSGAIQTDDYLRFRMETGGTINLSKLRSTSNRVWFDVAEQGVLELGDLAVTANALFQMEHISSQVHVHGSLFLAPTSQFLMASGAKIDVAGDFLFQNTDETKLQFDVGVLHMNGSGMQFLEAGGADNGVPGTGTNNFGIGRLEIGDDGHPTTVNVLDLFNNGNRGALGQEALYLNGLGGADGLLLHSGSILVLNDINVYARLNGQMKLLNSLFGNEVIGMALGAGFVALKQPDVGDYNFDGVIDDRDYQTWRTSFGSTTSLAADGNHNGVVDAADYVMWRNGMVTFASAHASTPSAVPEPSSVAIVLLACVLCLVAGRCHCYLR